MAWKKRARSSWTVSFQQGCDSNSRRLSPEQLQDCFQAGSDLFDHIYSRQSHKLRQVLTHNHPDLGEYILNFQYGPLFAPASQYLHTSEPVWEVNRVRMSLVAIAALHAQGGVAPQVVSHIYGLLRARPVLEQMNNYAEREGIEFLTSEDGAQWALELVNEVCRVVEGSEDAERESSSPDTSASRPSKL